MRGLLEKLRLIVHLKVKVNIHRDDFIKRMKLKTGDPGLLILDALSKTQYQYTGTVTEKSFEIKRRRKMFEKNLGFSKAKGKFIQFGNVLTIESEIFVPQRTFVPWYLFFYMPLYCFFIGSAILSDKSFISLLLVLVFGGVMLWIPYSMMKREVAQLKDQLETEFRDIAKG